MTSMRKNIFPQNIERSLGSVDRVKRFSLTLTALQGNEFNSRDVTELWRNNIPKGLPLA